MRIRLFVALIFKDDLLNKIIDFREGIYPNDNKAKWEGKDKLHLTLKFLGNVDEEHIPEINHKLNSILKKHYKIEVKFSKFALLKNIQHQKYCGWVFSKLSTL